MLSCQLLTSISCLISLISAFRDVKNLLQIIIFFFFCFVFVFPISVLSFKEILYISRWLPGNPCKIYYYYYYPLGRFERTKTVLMGTNTPHTCIPGLVWQKQARRSSQFELKVGELGFPIHFVCVSAALYHRGVRGRHFPLRWIWPIR